MQSLFIWDFHSVLEKGNDNAVVDITNHVLQSFGHDRRLSIQESLLLSGKKWFQYFEFLLPQKKKETHLKLQNACFNLSLNEPERVAKHLLPNDHVDTVLSTINKSPHEQILISNSSPKGLNLFLSMIGIDIYFPKTHRFGCDNHKTQGKTKKSCLNDFLKQSNNFNEVISIGDSPKDITMIEELPNTTTYLYAHPNRPFREVNAHFRIRDLRKVLEHPALSKGLTRMF